MLVLYRLTYDSVPLTRTNIEDAVRFRTKRCIRRGLLWGNGCSPDLCYLPAELVWVCHSVDRVEETAAPTHLHAAQERSLPACGRTRMANRTGVVDTRPSQWHSLRRVPSWRRCCQPFDGRLLIHGRFALRSKS